MAKKFSIAQNPTFKAKVSIPRIGGADIEVEFEYKFIPRKQLAAVFEGWQEGFDHIKASLTEESKLTELSDLEIELQVEQLKDILVGWGFDDEFNDENIRAVVELSAQATQAIVDGFHSAYTKGKLGN